MTKIIISVIVLVGAIALFVIYKDRIFGTFGDAGKGVSSFFGSAGDGITDFFGGLGTNNKSSSNNDNNNNNISPDPAKQTDAQQEELFGKTLSDEEELIINYNDNPTSLSSAQTKQAQGIIQDQIDNDPNNNDDSKFQPKAGQPAYDPYDPYGKKNKDDEDEEEEEPLSEVPRSRPQQRVTQTFRSEIKGVTGVPGGPSGGNWVIRKVKQSANEKKLMEKGMSEKDIMNRRRSLNRESDRMKEIRRKALQSKEDALRKLNQRQQNQNSRDAELQRRVDASNRRSQGRYYGKTPEEVSIMLTGGNIYNR